MKTLFERVFAGNDEMYALAVKAVDEALAKLGPDAPATFGDTAYSLPCLYAMTGRKVATVGEAKEALETTIKDFMTRNNRTKDIFTSGIATALSAEMIELIRHGYGNIVCAQPFGCLPNHICGKGMIHKLRTLYPESNIVAIDYDASATRVNQENRIKLMLAVAREEL